MGALRKKTVILVTHQVEFLPAVDLILVPPVSVWDVIIAIKHCRIVLVVVTYEGGYSLAVVRCEGETNVSPPDIPYNQGNLQAGIFEHSPPISKYSITAPLDCTSIFVYL